MLTEKEKEELLEEAKRRYPINSRHKGFNGNSNFLVKNIRFSQYSNTDRIMGDETGCIYDVDTKKWSEIIVPQPLELLINKIQEQFPIY